MRFIVSTSTLLKQLQSVSGALSSSTVLPILENFLFEIKDGNLTISATDLQTSMTTSLNVEAKENGRIAIPSRILLETLKSLPEQPVAFSIDDQTFAIEINAGDGKYKLSGENGEDFPKIPVVENASSVNLPASVLAEAINKTIFAVSNDELRPAMTGVYCQLSSQYLTFVATDAHKLVRYRRLDAKAESKATSRYLRITVSFNFKIKNKHNDTKPGLTLTCRDHFPPMTPASLEAALPLPVATAVEFFCDAVILVLPWIWVPPLMAPAVFLAVLSCPVAVAVLFSCLALMSVLP